MKVPVGVVVERRKAISQWTDFVWLPVAVLPDVPPAQPWTVLNHEADRTTFYAGPGMVELFVAGTSNYRDNLVAGPQLWIVLRPTEADPPFQVMSVTADPSEGEGFSEVGNDIVEPVPMPESIRKALEAFVAEHHVEQTFYKRKRDRANTEALGRHGRTEDDR